MSATKDHAGYIHETRGPRRKGGISIERLKAAIQDLYDFQPREFEPSVLAKEIGHGFLLISDLEAGGFSKEEQHEGVEPDIVEKAKAHAAENCDCGADHSDLSLDDASTFGVCDTCSLSVLAIGYKAIQGLITRAASKGYAMELGEMITGLEIN